MPELKRGWQEDLELVQRIRQLSERIKPVAHFATYLKFKGDRAKEMPDKPKADFPGRLYYLKPVDPVDEAFTWEPEPDTLARGIREFDRIQTKHLWGYYGFFKPSVAEVLLQVPEKYLDRVVAFETLTDGIRMQGDFHIATTILYEKE